MPLPIPVFVDTNVVRVSQLSLTPALPKVGDVVTVTLAILNESALPLANVEWKLSGALDKSGKIVAIAPRARQVVSHTFTARAGGANITAEVDPQKKLNEPAAHRANNTAKLSAAVSTDMSSSWSAWASKAAAKMDAFIRHYKGRTSVEGAIDAGVLKIHKLKVQGAGTGNVRDLKQLLTADGIPDDVAQAMATGFARAYEAWASNYRATVPAYPTFAAWPAAQAGPMPNVPFPLAVAGSFPGSAAAIANDVRSELSETRKAEPGAPEAIRNLSEAMHGYLATWLVTQSVHGAMGKGRVPSYAPPVVLVGPVAGGTIEPASSHLP